MFMYQLETSYLTANPMIKVWRGITVLKSLRNLILRMRSQYFVVQQFNFMIVRALIKNLLYGICVCVCVRVCICAACVCV